MTKRAARTLRQVFGHPLPRDLRWKDLVAMCEELDVDVRDRGNTVAFVFKGRVASCHKPHGKATDKGCVAAVRNLLRAGGIEPDGVK